MEKEEYTIEYIINEIIMYKKNIEIDFSIMDTIVNDDVTNIIELNEQLGLIRKKIQNYIFGLDILNDILQKKIEQYPNIEINNMAKVLNLLQSIRNSSSLICQHIHSIVKNNKLN